MISSMLGKADNNIRNMLCNPESIGTSCKAQRFIYMSPYFLTNDNNNMHGMHLG